MLTDSQTARERESATAKRAVRQWRKECTKKRLNAKESEMANGCRTGLLAVMTEEILEAQVEAEAKAESKSNAKLEALRQRC